MMILKRKLEVKKKLKHSPVGDADVNILEGLLGCKNKQGLLTIYMICSVFKFEKIK